MVVLAAIVLDVVVVAVCWWAIVTWRRRRRATRRYEHELAGTMASAHAAAAPAQPAVFDLIASGAYQDWLDTNHRTDDDPRVGQAATDPPNVPARPSRPVPLSRPVSRPDELSRPVPPSRPATLGRPVRPAVAAARRRHPASRALLASPSGAQWADVLPNVWATADRGTGPATHAATTTPTTTGPSIGDAIQTARQLGGDDDQPDSLFVTGFSVPQRADMRLPHESDPDESDSATLGSAPGRLSELLMVRLRALRDSPGMAVAEHINNPAPSGD